MLHRTAADEAEMTHGRQPECPEADMPAKKQNSYNCRTISTVVLIRANIYTVNEIHTTLSQNHT